MTRPRSQVPILLSLLAASAVMARPGSAQKMALRWKYEPGSELVYRVTNQQEMDMAAMGGTSTSEQIQTMRWRVVEVGADGNATVTVTTERVQIELEGLAGNVSYDSETGELPDHPQAQIFAAMAGTSYTVVIGPNGEVKAVRGVDELRRRVLAAMPAQQAAMAQAMSDQLFSDEAMTRMMQQSIQLFPEEPVGPTDSWNSSFSIPLPMLGTITTNMTFTLNGFEQRAERTVASIATSGELVLGRDAAGQLPVTLDLSTTDMSGSMDFDVDRGLTLSSTMSMTMQMTVEAGGQQMSVGMRQTSNVDLIEYVPGRQADPLRPADCDHVGAAVASMRDQISASTCSTACRPRAMAPVMFWCPFSSE